MAQGEATLLLKIKQVGGEILDRFVFSIGDVFNALSALPSAAMEALNAFKEEEAAVNKLNTAMINAGTFTGDLQAEYLQLASALQKTTTFSDDSIISAQATIQAMIGQRTVTKELMEATLDLAAGKKIDLATAAEMVGKTIGTETDALKRQGVIVKETTDETQKMGNVIDAINGKYLGQAATMAKNLGVMDQLKNEWGDFLENTGSLLAPFATSLATATKNVLSFVNSLSDVDPKKMKADELVAEGGKIQEKLRQLEDQWAKAMSSPGANSDARIAAITAEKMALTERLANLKEHLLATYEAEAAAEEAKKTKQEEDAAAALEKRKAANEQELLDLAMQEEMKANTEIGAEIAKNEAIIASKSSASVRLQALRANDAIKKNISDKLEVKSEKEKNELMVKNRESTLNTIATMQNSNNKALAAAGKAAAITQIAIETPVAVSKALSAFPPPMSFVAAGLVAAAMAAQAARIAGVQLAEGGIVKATPGGIQATIGEGGRDEAVIPLEDGKIPGGGGGEGLTINFNGPIMGSESQAMELARAIDKSLLKLRQSGQSVAFETDVF